MIGDLTYRCNDCDEVFDTPDSKSICLEDYNGVSDIFNRRSWINVNVCPCCGSDDIDDFIESEDDEEWED